MKKAYAGEFYQKAKHKLLLKKFSSIKGTINRKKNKRNKKGKKI